MLTIWWNEMISTYAYQQMNLLIIKTINQIISSQMKIELLWRKFYDQSSFIFVQMVYTIIPIHCIGNILECIFNFMQPLIHSTSNNIQNSSPLFNLNLRFFILIIVFYSFGSPWKEVVKLGILDCGFDYALILLFGRCL